MGLGSGDEDRLRGIEAELTASDPQLAARFRRWRRPRGAPVPAGWTVVPAWAAAVFLVAASAWVVSPGTGWLLAVVAVVWAARTARRRARDRAEQDSGWWYRPIDRW